MTRKSITLDDIEELLDWKLEEKLDQKLKPIKEDITLIKQVTEKMNDRMNKGFSVLTQNIERLEEINLAYIEDSDDHELRIKRLEKRAGITTNNN